MNKKSLTLNKKRSFLEAETIKFNKVRIKSIMRNFSQEAKNLKSPKTMEVRR